MLRGYYGNRSYNVLTISKKYLSRCRCDVYLTALIQTLKGFSEGRLPFSDGFCRSLYFMFTVRLLFYHNYSQLTRYCLSLYPSVCSPPGSGGVVSEE